MVEEKENANKWLVVVGLIVVGLLIGGGLVFAGYKLTQQRVPEFEEFEVPATSVAQPSQPTPTESASGGPTGGGGGGTSAEEVASFNSADGVDSSVGASRGSPLLRIDSELPASLQRELVLPGLGAHVGFR